jgi:uncharacterized protein (TIGR03086 family)
MTVIDMEPAAQRMARLIEGVGNEQLNLPTPCPDYTVGDLLDHIDTLSVAFVEAANKTRDAGTVPAPGSSARLGGDWRTRIPAQLATMAEAWRDPEAWTGMTVIGGGDTPGEVCGLIGLDELIVHGWDVARATDQKFACDDVSLEACRNVLSMFAVPGKVVDPGAPFGTVVDVPEDAPLLDRVLGLSGRDPGWSPG